VNAIITSSSPTLSSLMTIYRPQRKLVLVEDAESLVALPRIIEVVVGLVAVRSRCAVSDPVVLAELHHLQVHSFPARLEISVINTTMQVC